MTDGEIQSIAAFGVAAMKEAYGSLDTAGLHYVVIVTDEITVGSCAHGDPLAFVAATDTALRVFIRRLHTNSAPPPKGTT